jgi:predicted MFS family arabinose efflux permease
MKRTFVQAGSLWSRNLVLLAIPVFVFSFGNGLFSGVSTNFYIDTMGFDGRQVLWLAGLREIPGLALMFVAALMIKIPLAYRAGLAMILMGVGYALYALVGSFAGLVAVAIAASLGFHLWMPLRNALAMALAPRERSGQVLGAITSVQSFATIVGVGAVALLSKVISEIPLRSYFVIGGALIAVGSILLFRLPTTLGAPPKNERRLLLKRKYWVFYVLTFFEGSRIQVFHAFGTLVLVQSYHWEVWRISLLLMVSSTVNFLAAPYLGRALDRLGERATLTTSYVLLALCFVGYATIHNAMILGALLVVINLLVLLHMGLQTYVNRIAPREELTPTLTAGVSINHVTSVGMSLAAGSLLALVGYEALCWGVVGVIMLSVPFALAMRSVRPLAVQPSAVTAE